MSFSKDDFHIIDHIEYILTSSVARLGQVVCLPFKMLAFLSYGWFAGRNRRWPRYMTFRYFFKNIPLMSLKRCVHALYPLFDCPERLLRAGQSLIVTNNNARRSCVCISLYLEASRTHCVLLSVQSLSNTNTCWFMTITCYIKLIYHPENPCPVRIKKDSHSLQNFWETYRQ